MVMVEEKGSASGEQDYTQDGTVDLKGRPVLRSQTGRWKACSFIVGINKEAFCFLKGYYERYSNLSLFSMLLFFFTYRDIRDFTLYFSRAPLVSYFTLPLSK
jgi:hypothetical protein